MLFALELESTVAVADGDGERVATGFLDEFDGFLGVGVVAAGGVCAAFFAFVKLRANQMAEFGFHRTIMCVCVFDNLAGDLGVLLKRLMRGINHHAGESLINALFAQLERIAVIEMNRDGDVAQANSGFDELLEVNRVGVGARAFGNLKDQRGFFLFTGFNNRLDEFHVVDVESTEGVFACESFREEVFSMCQWHSF